MKGKKTILGMIVVYAILTGSAWAGIAVPVSPGGGTELTAQHCPTFSWSGSDGAQSYRVEVYEQVTSEIVERGAMSGMLTPVVAKEIPAPALSWTPSTGECLSRGMRYVWYVEGVDAEGAGQWSGGQVFQVEAAALSVEQEEAVQEVVKGYLSGGGSGGERTTNTSANISSSGGITPLYAEGSSNNFFGIGAGAVTTGGNNTFIGAYAGNHNTTGFSNSFLGYQAGYTNTEGHNNNFFGGYAGYGNITGSFNSFFGYSAGNDNTLGICNSSFGYKAGYSNTEGNYNTFLGYYTGYSATGDNNLMVGYNAGYNNSTGSSNVFLGNQAGYNETGSNKLYIDNCYTGGSCTDPLIYGEFDNRIVRISGRLEMVTVATPSDIRYKKEIHVLDSPLEKVMELEGVTYEWDKDKVRGAGFESGRQIGLIAQEVEKVLPELVYTDARGYKTLSYDKLGPVLVEAVKEQQREIEEKDARIAKLEKALEEQKKSLVSQQEAIASMIARLAAIERSAKTVALK